MAIGSTTATATTSAASAMGCGHAKSREIRVGLVMYGGISLAVYVNGVSREFFNAVRGRGVYRLLKALTDSDVVVDVISGTSAGGINGVLLGYALCNEREFAACADLWREHGDIARLLRDSADTGHGAYSLLNSETYYQPKLAAAFGDMAPCGVRADEDVSSHRRTAGRAPAVLRRTRSRALCPRAGGPAAQCAAGGSEGAGRNP
jgi:hypothetical protein